MAMAVSNAEQDVGYAAVLHGKNDLRFETAPSLGSLKAGMVRVAVKAMSVCGSDVHLIAKVGPFVSRLDVVVRRQKLSLVNVFRNRCLLEVRAFVTQGKIGIWELSDPMVIGHESAGYALLLQLWYLY